MMLFKFKRCLQKMKWLIALAVFPFTSYIAAAAALPDIHARAAILLDAKTGQILFQKNANERNPPASTTKVLTAIIAIESGHLDDEVTVSQQAASTCGSSLYLFPGQKLTLRELVTGLLLRSGNDAAVAIAEFLAGSVENFAALMNKKAELLGAYNSQFRNPHGLSTSGHYTTAFDLAWITRYALTNPTFAAIVSKKETAIEWLDRSGHEHAQNLRNTNKLLWMLADADGVKTGTTNAAGPCLISSATRGNQKLIAVVLNDHARWQDSLRLLKYGFANFALFEYASKDDILAALPVEDGMQPYADAIVADQADLIVNAADRPYVTVEVDLPKKIKAPVYQGQKIGEIIFFVKDKAIKTVDINAAQFVEERTATRVFLQHLIQFFRHLDEWGLL
jgi:D-alanyl-D-alanine carboxypeptidase (penicillin-binding protein 5/6)